MWDTKEQMKRSKLLLSSVCSRAAQFQQAAGLSEGRLSYPWAWGLRLTLPSVWDPAALAWSDSLVISVSPSRRGRIFFFHHYEADNRSHVEISCLLWEGAHNGTGEGLWLLSLKSDRKTWEWPQRPFPSPCTSGGSSRELGRREGWGKCVVKIYFTSHYEFVDNKFN